MLTVADPSTVYCGWILPDGKIYACELGQHTTICAALWDKLGQAPPNPEAAAERAGWIKLTTICGGLNAYLFRGLTDDQRWSLVDWCVAHGLPYSHYLE